VTLREAAAAAKEPGDAIRRAAWPARYWARLDPWGHWFEDVLGDDGKWPDPRAVRATAFFKRGDLLADDWEVRPK
jgi:hypothetical protein